MANGGEKSITTYIMSIFMALLIGLSSWLLKTTQDLSTRLAVGEETRQWLRKDLDKMDDKLDAVSSRLGKMEELLARYLSETQRRATIPDTRPN